MVLGIFVSYAVLRCCGACLFLQWCFIYLLVASVSNYAIAWLAICQSSYSWVLFNTLRPRQNGRRFADDTFKRIFLNENVMIAIKISLKFVPKVRINNIPVLVRLLTHI